MENNSNKCLSGADTSIYHIPACSMFVFNTHFTVKLSSKGYCEDENESIMKCTIILRIMSYNNIYSEFFGKKVKAFGTSLAQRAIKEINKQTNENVINLIMYLQQILTTESSKKTKTDISSCVQPVYYPCY